MDQAAGATAVVVVVAAAAATPCYDEALASPGLRLIGVGTGAMVRCPSLPAHCHSTGHIGHVGQVTLQRQSMADGSFHHLNWTILHYTPKKRERKERQSQKVKKK
jgi:hypothetical protein